MSASLVGSEMCIRDRFAARGDDLFDDSNSLVQGLALVAQLALGLALLEACLLYTSDAADDM
eukprot:14480416-Alexandrium_andersonii.AAC.1